VSRAPAGHQPWHVSIQERVSQAEAAQVLTAAETAARSDKVSPLSEQVRLQLRDANGAPSHHLLVWRGGELLGFAFLDDPEPPAGRSGELFVHPAHRGRGVGRALAVAVTGDSGGRAVRIWAHGDLPAAAGLARASGFTRARALWQMRRPLRAETVAEPRFGEGVRLRTFVPGQDEPQWLALNRRAFAHHPEQGRWTRRDLERREREPWFDPAGFFLAERGGRLAGFHWTKIHPPAAGTEEAVGEVYVVGVAPEEQGSGLGRALTLAGLRHLRDRGVGVVILYVEADNAPAVRLYTSMGFAHTTTDVMYEHTPKPAA
jgi:mycothiol synthase